MTIKKLLTIAYVCVFGALPLAPLQAANYYGPKKALAVEAVCKNAAGDGAIIQTAVSTGKTIHIIGPCVGDTTVVVSTPGQEIFGDGRVSTVISVSAVVAGAGTFQCTTGSAQSQTTGPYFHDFGITFAQVDTNLRASLTNFKPAFSCPTTSRGKIERVRIAEAMIGVDIQGQSGGFTIADLDVSCLSVCIIMDGSTDSIRLSRIHIWPFGDEFLTGGCGSASLTGLCAIYGAPNITGTIQTTAGTAGAIGIASGRVDDFHLSESLILIGQGISFFTGVSGNPGDTFGDITNSDFDTYGGIFMNGGRISASALIFTLINTDYRAAVVNLGEFRCGSCRFLLASGAGGGNVPIVLNGAGADNNGTSFSLSNSYISEGTADQSFIYAFGGGTLNINGLQVQATVATGSQPVICAPCDGSTFITSNISGVQPVNNVTSRTLVSINFDAYHRIVGNGLKTGWANACPATQTLMRSGLNGTAANVTCN